MENKIVGLTQETEKNIYDCYAFDDPAYCCGGNSHKCKGCPHYSKTLEDLIDEISEEVRIRMSKEDVMDADWDEPKEYYFFEEVRRRIENRKPGWEILYDEYVGSNGIDSPFECETPS